MKKEIEKTFSDVFRIFSNARVHFLISLIVSMVASFLTKNLIVFFLVAIPMYMMAATIGVLQLRVELNNSLNRTLIKNMEYDNSLLSQATIILHEDYQKGQEIMSDILRANTKIIENMKNIYDNNEKD
jgi:hypothetical protein